MKYKDKSTTEINKNWEYRNENKSSRWDSHSRTGKRQLERLFVSFSYKVSDRLWWDSLSFNDKLSVYRKSTEDGFNESKMKSIYKGDVSKYRDSKIKLLLD